MGYSLNDKSGSSRVLNSENKLDICNMSLLYNQHVCGKNCYQLFNIFTCYKFQYQFSAQCRINQGRTRTSVILNRKIPLYYLLFKFNLYELKLNLFEISYFCYKQYWEYKGCYFYKAVPLCFPDRRLTSCTGSIGKLRQQTILRDNPREVIQRY